MSDQETNQTEPAAEQTKAVAVVKERLITQNSVAIWDTAELEHMGRVGAIMADSGLMSETISKDGDQDAPRGMVVSRCVMIANLARECGANPLMFLQGCSIIGRKLHLEGKLVNAIIRSRTGVNLRFQFGAWDTDHIAFPPKIPAIDGNGQPMTDAEGRPLLVDDPAFFHGLGERLAVRAFDPNDPARFVDGSVGLWKTARNGSPWTKQGDWRRQLIYRAAPVWARLYEPGAVLGIYSEADGDDDIDAQEAQPAAERGRRPRRDLRSKLTNEGASEHGAEGFDRAGIAETLNGGAGDEQAGAGEVHDAEFEEVPGVIGFRKVGKPFDPAKSPEAHPGEGWEAVWGYPATGEMIGDGAVPAEVLAQAAAGDQPAATDMLDPDSPLTTAADGAGEDESDGDFGAEVQAQAEALARMSPHDEDVEVIVSRLLAAQENSEPVEQGHAEEGEQYLIAGEGLDGNGRRLTYKDGARFSAVKSYGKFKVYAIHAPEVPAAGGGGEAAGNAPSMPAGPTETASVQSVEAEPASSGSATAASTASPEAAAGSGPNATSAPQDAGSPGGDDTPLGRMATMTSWAEIKAEFAALNKTPEWLQANEAEQNEVRRAVWAQVARVKKDHGDPVDWALDVSAFGLWMTTQDGRDGADAIEGTFAVLKNQPIWQKLKPEQRTVLEDRVAAALKRTRVS